MLTSKDILQIDATILAGLFVLMTIISLSGISPTQQLQQINNQIADLDHLKLVKTTLGNKLNSLLQDADRLSYESKLLQGNSSEIKMLEFNITMNEYQKTKQDLYNIDDKLAHESDLLEKQNQTMMEIKQRNVEIGNFFTKIPEIWFYRVGGTFAVSAILAIFLSVYEERTGRLPTFLKTSSLGCMGAGFVFLIVMVWTIGSL